MRPRYHRRRLNSYCAAGLNPHALMGTTGSPIVTPPLFTARSYDSDSAGLSLTLCALQIYLLTYLLSAVFQGKLSVPSVCLSVCDVEVSRLYDYIRGNSAKIISRLISLTISLSADPNMTDLLQREHAKFKPEYDGVGKIVDFRHLSRRRPISETVQDKGPSCY